MFSAVAACGDSHGVMHGDAGVDGPGIDAVIDEPVDAAIDTPPAMPDCSDGTDNDSDGHTDFPDDPGCASAADDDEVDPPACSDGTDNDSDGHTDFPNDPGCSSATDDDELNPPACDDGADNDRDGHVDFPADPGCSSATDDNELDVAECNDGIDNDGDGETDFPADGSCASGSAASEACDITEPLIELMTRETIVEVTAGDVSDTAVSCGASSNIARDRHYSLTVPDMVELSILTNGATDHEPLLMDGTCGGAPIACKSFFDDLVGVRTYGLTAGTYYVVLDATDPADDVGNVAITIDGKIAPGARCDGPLATAGAFRCAYDYLCAGPLDNKTCQPGACGNGIDDDNDGVTDYPFDPGCTNLGDDAETDSCPGAECPVCANHSDDDSDGMIDLADIGCTSAAETSETFCLPEASHEVQPTLTTPMVSGTVVGADTEIWDSWCADFEGPGVVYPVWLPVPVELFTVQVAGDGFYPAPQLYQANCRQQYACIYPQFMTQTMNAAGLPPGWYALSVRSGDFAEEGPYTMTAHGIVAPGTPCSSPLFTSGLLTCRAGTTCTGSPAICQ